ncbi:MAG: SCO family protein [Fimbriimonas sp.]|nr:SCO family protein [Fimbriimonas sp.]
MSSHILARRLACLSAWCLLAVVAMGQGFQQATAVVPPSVNISDVRIIQRLGSQLPGDVPFTDQDGHAVTFGSLLKGRPALVLAIFYECAGVCTLEMENLATTLSKIDDKLVGRDLSVIVIGINPKEKPDEAKARLEETLAGSKKLKATEAGWHFLTGSLDSIHKITNPLGFFYTYDPATDVINHPAGVMFVTPSGVVSSYILGAQYTTSGFRKAIDLASKSQIGVKSPDIFFGCIHVDPLTGKRSIVIQNVLKVAGVVTIVVLALTLLTLGGKTRFGKNKIGLEDEWDLPDE